MSTQQTLNALAHTSPEALRTTTGPLTMRWACEKGMLIARWVKTEPSKGARRGPRAGSAEKMTGRRGRRAAELDCDPIGGAMFSKTLHLESERRRGIAIGAMLVTAWLSTVTASAQGADPKAPGNGPGSQIVKSPTSESQSLHLRVKDGLLTLNAKQRPYAEVLGAIQKETGIRFHYTLPMAQAVTLSFEDLPVREALKRLLGREAQLMFRFPEGWSAASHAGIPEDV